MDDRSPSTTTPASRPPPPPLNPDELASHRQRRLSFGIPETPAAAETTDDPATQIAGLLRTVAELEKTSRRTQAENERLTAQEAASSSKAAAAEGSSTRAAISELTVKLNTLADLVVALAEKEDRPAPKATTTRTAGGTGPNSESETDSDSDSEATRKATAMAETGPACISIFCRSINYTITDPDRISDRHDVDGVDSDYKRISDKRPLILSDLTGATGKQGAQLKEVAESQLRRISEGIKPRPSAQCAIALTVFAMHDKLPEVVQCRLQSAIVAARNCTSRHAVKKLIRACKKKRRVPSSLLQRAVRISDSPLITAIILEAAQGGDCLINSIWDLIVTVISIDRNPATTLSTVQSQWQDLGGGDVEAALFRELSLYDTAVALLGDNKGAKPFCSFEDRIRNILRCRSTADCDVEAAFKTRLDLDQLDHIDLDWDDVWDRVIDAESAAVRAQKNCNHKNRRPQSDHPATDLISMACVLHGQGGHDTADCHCLKKYPALSHATIRVLKFNGMCVIGYAEQHPQGQCGRKDCKFDHPPKEHVEALLRQPIMSSIASGATNQGPPPSKMLGPNIPAASHTSLIANPAIEALQPPSLTAPGFVPTPNDDLYGSFAMVEYTGEED